MLPDKSKIKIGNNKANIENFINDVIIIPRRSLRYWSNITNQTPAAKIGYIGQHLASLITGVRGTGSGARGDDLADTTEVKSCNKVDQADKCRCCGHRVMRYDVKCPNCDSEDIERKNDSKWLFSIRDEYELDQYKNLNRILLLLMDYPGFLNNDFSDIMISAFEIYPKENRMNVFNQLIDNHYRNIYRPKADEGKKTNPMNLHPWSFQFYKCNPILVFQCVITDIDNNPEIKIIKYIDPEEERGIDTESVLMPSNLLTKKEWNILLSSANYEQDICPLLKDNIQKEKFESLSNDDKIKYLPYLDEKLRDFIPLRPIVSATQKDHYHR